MVFYSLNICYIYIKIDKTSDPSDSCSVVVKTTDHLRETEYVPRNNDTEVYHLPLLPKGSEKIFPWLRKGFRGGESLMSNPKSYT